MLNHWKSRYTGKAKIDWNALAKKGMESDYNGLPYIIGNGQMIPGLKMAPKVWKIIYDVKLGKPVALLNQVEAL